MNLKKEIEDNLILLILVPKDNYKEHLLNTASTMSKIFDKTMFLLVSKPYSTIKKEMEDNKIDIKKFYFIDTLTSTVKEPAKESICSFVSSPSDLTDIGVNFSQKCTICSAALIDSISTMLIYNDPNNVTKFVHTLITKARTLNKNLVIIALKEDNDSELVKELHVFCNKVVTYSL